MKQDELVFGQVRNRDGFEGSDLGEGGFVDAGDHVGGVVEVAFGEDLAID